MQNMVSIDFDDSYSNLQSFLITVKLLFLLWEYHYYTPLTEIEICTIGCKHRQIIFVKCTFISEAIESYFDYLDTLMIWDHIHKPNELENYKSLGWKGLPGTKTLLIIGLILSYKESQRKSIWPQSLHGEVLVLFSC
jgi:hypothetical protein